MKIDFDLAVLYYTGKADAAEKQKFENWLNEKAENIQEFDDFKKFWLASGKAYEYYVPDVKKLWNEVEVETIKKTPVRSKKRMLTNTWFKVAASIAIIIGLSISFKMIYDWSQIEEMITYTSANSVLTLELSDNSKVWLNSNSQIIVPGQFKGNIRKVYLRGNAFFEVTKNPKKPFIIAAHKTTTIVLGTSFCLKAPDDDSVVTLSVVTGKVSFTDENNPNNTSVVLSGQTASIDHQSNKIFKQSYKDQNFIAWKTGKIEFDNASLDEVCKVLSEYYNVSFKSDSSKDARNISFSGTFNNKSLPEVLDVIEFTIGVKFEKNKDVFEVKLKD
jgi:transmembrane sensor